MFGIGVVERSVEAEELEPGRPAEPREGRRLSVDPQGGGPLQHPPGRPAIQGSECEMEKVGE